MSDTQQEPTMSDTHKRPPRATLSSEESAIERDTQPEAPVTDAPSKRQP